MYVTVEDQRINLDAMADGPNSIQFNRHYSGGPICSPTRGTVLTGHNHNRCCIWRNNKHWNCRDFTKPSMLPLPPTEITVAEVLKDHGYYTAAFGKRHLGDSVPCLTATHYGQFLILVSMGLIHSVRLKEQFPHHYQTVTAIMRLDQPVLSPKQNRRTGLLKS